MRPPAPMILMLALLSPLPVAGQSLDPLIGARVDSDAWLTDADGAAATVRDLLDPAGTLMVLGYFRCTNLCGVLQRGLAETLEGSSRHPRVIFASLDPQEGPPDARAMRGELQQAVPGADLSNWRFLTGSEAALASLSAPLRMQTYVRPGGEVLVHPVATSVLTPGGALSEVFYGLDLDAGTLDTALANAEAGHVGGLRERIVLLCSGFDEAVGRVARIALDSIRLAGVVTLLALAGGLVLLSRRERR